MNMGDIGEYEPLQVRSGMPIGQNTQLTMWLTNSQDIIEDVIHTFRCEFLDSKTGEYTRPEGIKPIMNEEGIRLVRYILGNYLDRNTYITNVDERGFADLRRYGFLPINETFCLKYKELGIEKENLSIVLEMIKQKIEMALRRPLYHGERDFYATSVKESFVLNRDAQEKPKGGFSLFGNIFGGGKRE